MLNEDKSCCLFEFDNEIISTRMPEIKNVKLPKIAVMCFLGDCQEIICIIDPDITLS